MVSRVFETITWMADYNLLTRWSRRGPSHHANRGGDRRTA